ncbi:MAG TPA: DUF4328 domain-containing protein [Actinomycetota bacterium]|nr:DUF4328 domain-containing protein [Actinomycetota bacterium]
MTRCPWCAEEIPPEEAGARFCPFCGSDLTQAPPSPPAVAVPQFTHSGNRFVLGHGPDFYGIWDRTSPAEPAQRFPRTDQGWAEAWRWFSSWEPSAAPVNPDGSLGPPIGPLFQPTDALSRWVIAGLVAVPLLNLAQIPHNLRQMRLLSDTIAGRISIRELNARLAGPGVIGGLADLVGLTLIVLWLVWQHRSQSNLRALGMQDLRYTPGWAVGWWFIPVANIWMPYLTVRELWRASDPAAGPSDWKTRQARPVLAWWLTYLLPGVVIVPLFVIAAVQAADTEDVLPLLRVLQAMTIGGAVLQVAAAALATVIVLTVTRNQVAKRAVSVAAPTANLPGADG